MLNEPLITAPSAGAQGLRGTHLKPKYRICSQIHDRTSSSTMVGKAKENQEAKLMMPPLSGKRLENAGAC